MHVFFHALRFIASRSGRAFLAYAFGCAVLTGLIGLGVRNKPGLVEGANLGLGLFISFTVLGAAFFILNFRKSVENETTTLELNRTETFLHSIVENMPVMVTVKEAQD